MTLFPVSPGPAQANDGSPAMLPWIASDHGFPPTATASSRHLLLQSDLPGRNPDSGPGDIGKASLLSFIQVKEMLRP
jgi:hypothetical protein